MSLDWVTGCYALNRIADHPLFRSLLPGRMLADMPLGFIDIGTRGGVHGLLSPIAEITAVLGFEPDEAACSEINETNRAGNMPWAGLKVLPVALAENAGCATLHLCSAPTNHSLRAVNQEFAQRYRMDRFRQTGQFQLVTQTLDAVLFAQLKGETHWGEFIKLDTQGTEYEILKGADRTLRERAVALFVEVEFCQIYENQKMFSELEMLLRDYDFSFYGFHSTHERSCKLLDKKEFLGPERLLHADAVFFKDPLPGTPWRRQLNEREASVLFTCALILGYFDFALELAQQTFAPNGSERGNVMRLIEDLAHYDPADAENDARQLAALVTATPGLANVAVGRFVDQRRSICNFQDVPFKLE